MPAHRLTDEELMLEMVEKLKSEEYGYNAVRLLKDGTIIALHDLMYTRAIMVDCDLTGWARRFCFEDRSRADSEFLKFETGDDVPKGYTAKRPEVPTLDESWPSTFQSFKAVP